jgi:hypothetical protein
VGIRTGLINSVAAPARSMSPALAAGSGVDFSRLGIYETSSNRVWSPSLLSESVQINPALESVCGERGPARLPTTVPCSDLFEL